MTVPIHEAGRTLTLSEADGPRRRMLLISPGWGSSGYYSEELLREYAATALPAGSHMYVDHPSESEEIDRARVGRSIRDLAAVLDEAGTYDPNGPEGPGVYAVARIMPSYETMIAELAENIGVSIRGGGTGRYGEADGREGLIIDELFPVESIDFVAKAGRGGKVLELVESAREHQPAAGIDHALAEAEARLREARNCGQWFESRVHLDFTQNADRHYGEGWLTRDERIALSGAIGEALDAFAAALGREAPHLYERDLYTDPLEGKDKPGYEAGATTDVVETGDPNEAEEAAMNLEEALARITELEGNVSTIEGERDAAVAARDEATDETARLREGLVERDARDHVRTTIAAADHGLRPAAVERVVESVMRADLPVDDSGALSTDRLTESVAAAVEREQTYLSEATGARITGLGDTKTTTDVGDDTDLTEATASALAAFGITTPKEA